MTGTANSTAALAVRAVSVSIQKVRILQSVSVEVGRGQMVGLIGRNGAGKTTLMKAVMGLLSCQAGSIEIDGSPMEARDVYERVRMGVGYMPEERGLIGPLSIEENLRLPGWASGARDVDARLQRALTLIPELRSHLHVKALSLSGGQQKLAALARALVAADRLLLLDEPFEGVSPVLSRRLIQVISEARAMKLAILVAQSEIKHSLDVFDEIYRIERGMNVALTKTDSP